MIGKIVLKITCADCAKLLNRIQNEKIHARDVVYHSGLEFQITVSGWDYHHLCRLVKKLGGTVEIVKTSATSKHIRNIKNNSVVCLLTLILLVITLWIPRWVLFISVEGNSSVPTNQLLEAAQGCGLRFGAKRHTVRSEVIKNALLQKIPQLQWVGVNTRGCTAKISVREKTENDAESNIDNQVCSIVAARDGIIQECTVYRGNQLCTTGQAVKAGQTLVSGYTDCGTLIKATRADAEITALTFRNLKVITPTATAVRGVEQSKNYRYSLQLGKKRINLSKDSGNLDVSCVKIYTEKSVRLPGGFALPISLIQETIICYENAEQLPIVSDEAQWLDDFSQLYLRSTMIAGDVVSAQTEITHGDGFSCLRGRFACVEMIGQVKYEQMQLKE